MTVLGKASIKATTHVERTTILAWDTVHTLLDCSGYTMAYHLSMLMAVRLSTEQIMDMSWM